MSQGGGTERITQVLANALTQEHNYHVSVLNRENARVISFFPLEESVRLDVLPSGGVLKKILALRRYLKKEQIDILINVDVMLGILSFPAQLLYPRLKIISWEMFNIRNSIGNRYARLVREYALRHSAYYVNQTKGDMQAFQAEMKVKCPITYIHNPYLEKSAPGEYDLKSKVIITAGHFFRMKGFDLAVETARHVFDKHPAWQWRFYGDGQQLTAVKKLVEKYHLENNVLFCGRVSDMKQIYPQAAMYVMTSRSEGFGLVLTEAKSFHLPTLAFDVDFGPREIIEDGKSGYLVKPFDIEEMARKICGLIENADLRKCFSDHAIDNLSAFSIDAFVHKWKDIIDFVDKA